MQPVPPPKLTIKRQDGSYQELDWDRDAYLIGRDSANELIIDHQLASRRHARLERTSSGYYVHDLNSTNGTFVNGELITGSHLLMDQDQVVIADTIITFRDPEATARGPLPPEVLRVLREESKATEDEDLRVDSRSKEVYIQGELLAPSLTVKEFQLLELLYVKKGQVISKDEIARTVWDYPVYDYNAIDALVYRLRHRIEANPSNPRYLLTQRGFGYKLVTVWEPE